MRQMFLEENTWKVKRGSDRDPIVDDEGATATGITARVMLSEEPDGDPIGALDQAAVAITAGKLSAEFGGVALTDALDPLLTAAELAGDTLDIYERVIVAGSYSDYEKVRVQRHRPAGS